MHLKVAVFDVEREVQALALDGAGERGGDVEIERVAEFVRLGCAAGLDSRSQVAGVVTAEARFAQRSHQIAQRAEPEKVESLVGDFKARLRLRFANLPAGAGAARGIVRLVNADVVFPLHALDELLDQLLHLLGAHIFDLLAHLVVEHFAVQQRLGDGLAQVVERLLHVVEVVEVHVLLLEAALQQVVGERVEQVLHAHLRRGLGNVFLVLDELHKKCAPLRGSVHLRNLAAGSRPADCLPPAEAGSGFLVAFTQDLRPGLKQMPPLRGWSRGKSRSPSPTAIAQVEFFTHARTPWAKTKPPLRGSHKYNSELATSHRQLVSQESFYVTRQPLVALVVEQTTTLAPRIRHYFPLGPLADARCWPA